MSLPCRRSGDPMMPKPAQDWHPADVLAALKKRGLSLTGLSTANGYHPTAAGKALKNPWPAMEAIIATALGLTPGDIWPSREPPVGAKPPKGAPWGALGAPPRGEGE